MKKGPGPKLPLRVVGIGASAGGLDALQQLIAAIPADTGFAVIVLQHLPPAQTGVLAALLAKVTTLPVIDVESGHRIAPNSILVVPSRAYVELVRAQLVLRIGKTGPKPRKPIDVLFGSLAEVLQEQAIGVVLSGTANDGTEGLRAIRAAGGLTFAQDPVTAQFDEMPRSAIAAGVVESALGPAAIGEELAAIAKHGPRTVALVSSEPGIDNVLDQLREASGVDFTSYKRTTIERRLARRLAKHRLGSLAEYSAFLVEHPEEATTVYEDLLIHVTEFFRDEDLLEKVVATLVELRPKPRDEPIRIWVPGCATGEEVYSLAILLLERLGMNRALQLFGTDLSERSIEVARIGHYPAAIANRVSPERLARFFQRDDSGYRIRREVRERCVFARHDLVTDPPFSRLDLVSCRNVLIYLGPELQQRVMPILHYALAQPGILLLGRAETIGAFDELFDTVNADARIYARKPAPRTSLTFPLAGRLGRQPWRRSPDRLRSTPDVLRDVDHLLLTRYGPACVLVDDNLDVIQFRGRTGPFLEPAPGLPQHNVLRMARDGIGAGLSLALDEARRTDQTVRRDGVRARDSEQVVDVEVVPIRGPNDPTRHFLVIFEERAADPRPRRGKPARPVARDRSEVARLREELTTTKEYLQARVSQHLATSEELGIVNEELQSTNEELQSTNEELQTAKEELQSTNEELETVNEELQRGNAELRDANDDLVNVLASVEIAIIIVDIDRRVRRFTPKARAVLKLIPGDVGRPIGDLQPSVDVPALDARIAEVIETLTLHESEVSDHEGGFFRMQIRPYRAADHKIGGAVIAFVDITTLRAARDLARSIVEAVPTPLVVLDDRLRVVSANAAFDAAFGAAATGAALFELGAWRGADLRAALDEVLTRGRSFDDLAVEFRGAGGDRVLHVGARAMPSFDGSARLLVGIADVTERTQLETLRSAAQLERQAFLDTVSHELRSPLGVILLWARAIRDLEHDDPRRLHGLDTIIEAAQAESRIVEDLLDLSLSRTTELAVQLETLDPAPVVRSAITTLTAEAVSKELALETNIGPVHDILADPRRLSQIVSGLLANAIKFTPMGGTITVELADTDHAVELRVINSGPSIEPSLLERIFEPFTRADASTTRAHGGLGIGLSLVRNLVERHGGTIAATSPPGKGATFTVRIPTISS